MSYPLTFNSTRLNTYHYKDGLEISERIDWSRVLHRLDGPAIQCEDGYNNWYINGNHIKCRTNEQFLRLMKLKAFL